MLDGRLISPRVIAVLIAVLLIAGCVPVEPSRAPTTASTEPIGRQMMRAAPDLKDARFSNLLNFETDTDAVFIVTPSARIDFSRGHTGAASLRVSPRSLGFSVKLSSLLAGREFPGNWTLLGAYFYTDHATEITAACVHDGTTLCQQRVELKPGAWTAVMLDISSLQGHETPSALQFAFNPSDGATIWCDDVTLIDNSHTYVEPDPSAPMTTWTISRRGFSYVGELPGRFAFKLDSAEAHAGGWTLDEANPMRARFSSSGDQKCLTVYRDGRAYWDGDYKPMASQQVLDPAIGEEHLSPAEIDIAEGAGRLDRRSKGDANNDGYNETTATYRIIASGPRIELRITPHTRSLICPVLEVKGLPAGKVLATVEGKLLPEPQRLDDGSVLVELPSGIERRTTVNLSVSDDR